MILVHDLAYGDVSEPTQLIEEVSYCKLRDIEFLKIPFCRHCGWRLIKRTGESRWFFQGDSRNPDRYILDAGSSPA